MHDVASLKVFASLLLEDVVDALLAPPVDGIWSTALVGSEERVHKGIFMLGCESFSNRSLLSLGACRPAKTRHF